MIASVKNLLNVYNSKRPSNLGLSRLCRILIRGVYKGNSREIDIGIGSTAIDIRASFLMVLGAFYMALFLPRAVVSSTASQITLGLRTRCGR